MGTAAKPIRVKGHARVKAGLRWRWAISEPLLLTLLLLALSGGQQADPRPELPLVTEPPSGVVETSRKYAPVIVGAPDEFQKVMDAINPVLELNGFSPVSVLDEGSQGWWSVTSGNAQGAEVSILGRTWVELTLNVPVESETCAAVELTGLAP